MKKLKSGTPQEGKGTMKKYFALIVGMTLSVLFVLSTVHSFAQQRREAAPDREARVEVDQGPNAGPTPPTPMTPLTPPPGDFLFVGTEMAFGGKLVKGAPYSAQAVSERTQILSDGNRIITKSTSAVYRDSEGRTRREQTLNAIGPFANGGESAQTIFIDDPVAGTSYALSPRAQIAQKMPPMRFKFQTRVVGSGGEAVGIGPGAGVGGGTAVGVGIGPGAQGGQSGQWETAVPPVPPSERGDVERAARASRAAMDAGVVWSWRNQEARTESLGKQNIEGVEAEGTRSTITIPAGEIGNERAIEIVNERWYSPELQTVIMTRHNDPRTGEATYRLTNIDRSEPAKSLFEVPADFKIQEFGSRGIGMAAGGADAEGNYKFSVDSGPISGGVLNGKATSLPMPSYPPIAKAAHASGSVVVKVTIDEEGNVIAAQAASGHPLLQAVSVAAARQAKFSPTKLSGQPVKVQGVLVYTFNAE
jgi:TonB family protein